jgi:hypothetical protein
MGYFVLTGYLYLAKYAIFTTRKAECFVKKDLFVNDLEFKTRKIEFYTSYLQEI